jgi:hypothetical protein
VLEVDRSMWGGLVERSKLVPTGLESRFYGTGCCTCPVLRGFLYMSGLRRGKSRGGVAVVLSFLVIWPRPVVRVDSMAQDAVPHRFCEEYYNSWVVGEEVWQ